MLPAIKAGFFSHIPDAEYICLPVADGGEGTVDAMVAATGEKLSLWKSAGRWGKGPWGFMA